MFKGESTPLHTSLSCQVILYSSLLPVWRHGLGGRMCKCYFPSLCGGQLCKLHSRGYTGVYCWGIIVCLSAQRFFFLFFLSFSHSLTNVLRIMLLPYALLLSEVGGSSLCRPKPLLRKSSSWVYSSYRKLTTCHSFIDHRLKRKQWASRCWKSPLFLDSVHEAFLCLDRWDLGCVNTYTYPHTHAHTSWHHCYHVVIL